MLIDLDGGRRLQDAVDGSIDRRPRRQAQQPEHGSDKPGLRDAEGAVEPGMRGDGEGAGRRAHEALGTGLDERGERDGEFADAQPADAAGGVFGYAHVGHGLDGEVAEEDGVFTPSRARFQFRLPSALRVDFGFEFFGDGVFPE